jgi:hypothetical protein
MLIASQTLAKEAADAFLYVEAQVGERTKDLIYLRLNSLKGLGEDEGAVFCECVA